MVQKRGRAQDEQTGCDVAELEGADRQQRTQHTGLTQSVQLEPRVPHRGLGGGAAAARFAGGDRDRKRRKQAGNSGE